MSKKQNNKAVKFNQKKSREGQQKRKQKTKSPQQASTRGTAAGRKGDFIGRGFEPCFQSFVRSTGASPGFVLVADRVAKLLETHDPSGKQMKNDAKENLYRIEVLLHSHLRNGEVIPSFLVYNFREGALTSDLSLIRGQDFYRPGTSPSIYTDIRNAVGALTAILKAKADFENGLVRLTGNCQRLMGCWITSCNKKSLAEHTEAEWIVEEGVTYDTRKGQEQAEFLRKKLG